VRVRKEPNGEQVAILAEGEEVTGTLEGDWVNIGTGYVMASLCALVDKGDTGGAVEDLTKLTNPQLAKIARGLGCKVPRTAKKVEIIKLIEDARNA
jgi:hypothetical protein